MNFAYTQPDHSAELLEQDDEILLSLEPIGDSPDSAIPVPCAAPRWSPRSPAPKRGAVTRRDLRAAALGGALVMFVIGLVRVLHGPPWDEP